MANAESKKNDCTSFMIVNFIQVAILAFPIVNTVIHLNSKDEIVVSKVNYTDEFGLVDYNESNYFCIHIYYCEGHSNLKQENFETDFLAL